ncbi:hypothetical protein ACO0LB_13095 [Undibacterium sp. SXout7W]|uniref:hypothetical protein n=1 Tax=Undibacterium sp. SXout7W TaxID=3413049 RepID=UPI003BF2C359
MLKKSLLFCALLSSMLAIVAFSEQFNAMAAISIPQGQQEKSITGSNQESTTTTNPPSALQFDRGGVDRASVHLQILQQSNTHFSDNTSTKKPNAYDKKAQIKAPNNS